MDDLCWSKDCFYKSSDEEIEKKQQLSLIYNGVV